MSGVIAHRHFIFSDRSTEGELHRRPEAVEFYALVHVHDAVGGRRPSPQIVRRRCGFTGAGRDGRRLVEIRFVGILKGQDDRS